MTRYIASRLIDQLFLLNGTISCSLIVHKATLAPRSSSSSHHILQIFSFLQPLIFRLLLKCCVAFVEGQINETQ